MKQTHLHIPTRTARALSYSLSAFAALAALAATHALADKIKANNSAPLNDPSSWTANAVPDGTEFGVWDATVDAGNVTAPLGADMTWGGMKILNPGGPIWLTVGNILSLNGVGGLGVDMSGAMQDLQLDCGIRVANDQTWTVPADRTLTVIGEVAGTNALTKSGAGTAILGNKSYSGGTTVTGGLLIVSNDNGGYTMSGGALKLNYGSFWSAPTVAFTSDASVGTDNGRLDFAGAMGSPGFTWTKIGSGTMNIVHWGADPTAVVKASAIYVAEGTLGSLINGGSIVQWGGAGVGIIVSNGAALAANDGVTVPNPVTLGGGEGTGRGVLVSGRVNAGSANYTNTFTSNIVFNADSTIGTFGGILLLSGNLSGTANLTKIGSFDGYSQNRLILAGTNTYQGDLTISTGTVVLASAAALPTNHNLTLNNNGTLDLGGFDAWVSGFGDDFNGNTAIDNSGATTATLTFGGNNQQIYFTGALRNSGNALSLVKLGSSGAVFTGPTSFKGGIALQGGSLQLNIPTGTTTNGPVALADGTELDVIKTLASSSIKAAGLTLGTSGTTTLGIDLGNYGSPTVPVFNATNGAGVLAVGGAVTINIAGNSSVMSVGQFPLIKYLSRTGGGSFTLGNLPTQIAATLVTNTANKSIDLKITSAPVTKWVGNVNNLWDVGTTTNWAVLGAPTTYADYIGVLFDDTAKTNTVDLTTTLYPSATLVTTTNTYTFTGSGGLFNGDVSKDGSGTLVLLTTNSYNATTLSGGVLQVGNGGPAGSLGNASIQNDALLVLNVSEPMTIAPPILGVGTVTKQNTNTLTLSSANTYVGGTLISAGRVVLGNAAALGAPGAGTPLANISAGAGLDIGGKLLTTTNALRATGNGFNAAEGAVFNNGGGTCVGCGDVGINNLYLTGDTTIGGFGGDWVIGSSGAGITGNGYQLTKVGANILFLRTSTVGPLASFTVGGGGVLIECANPFGTGSLVILSNNASLDSWGNNSGFVAYNIPNNILVTNGGARIMNTRGHWWNTPDADTYTGAITLADNLIIQNSSARGTTLGQLTLNGPIGGSGGITKMGAYLATLGGANTYTGFTTVSNGTLAISAISLGGGGYLVNDGATLDVPRQSGAATLSVSNLTLGVAAGCNLSFQRVLSLTTNPVITAGSLTLQGATIVSLSPGAFAVPGQYPLIKFTGAIAGGGSIALATGVRGLPGSLVTNVANSSIDVLIPSGNPVYWTGTANNVWDIAGTANFKYLGSATTYQQATAPGDAVTFDDTGANPTVNLSASVSPALITVSNATKNYVFTNSVIAGTGGLLKLGPGTLVLSNGANTFTGGATVTGGLLQLGNDGSLNNSAGALSVLGGGSVDFNNWNPNALACTIIGAGFNGKGTLVANYTNAATAKGPKTITLAGSATIGGSNRWDLRATGAALLSPTNAYTLTKVGPNLIGMVATTVSPALGDIYVLGGLLGFQTSTTGYGDTNKSIYLFNGGGLEFYQTTVPVNKSIICSNGASLVADGGGSAANWNIIAAPISNITGQLTINANYNNGILISNVVSGDGNVYVQWNSDVLFAASNTFKGDFETQGRTKLVGNASINPTNNVTINNGGSGVLTVQDNAMVGGQALRIWSGPGTGALVVKNNGAINSRYIQVGGAFADWSGRADGTLTLQSGQTLRIDNNGRIKGNVVATSGSIFSPGGTGYIQSTGYLTNALTLQAGSTTLMEVSLNGGVTNNDAITVLGTLTYGGTLQVNNIGTNALAAGTSFKLFSFSNAPAGSFATVAANTPGQYVTWDTTQLPVSGTLRVAVATASSVPALTNSFSGGALNFAWGADHIGWRLVTNSVSLTATNAWYTYPGSQTTNSASVPVDPSQTNVFLRLVYP